EIRAAQRPDLDRHPDRPDLRRAGDQRRGRRDGVRLARHRHLRRAVHPAVRSQGDHRLHHLDRRADRDGESAGRHRPFVHRSAGKAVMAAGRREWHRFGKDRAAALGLALLVLLVLAAIFAPILSPFPGDVADFHTANRLHAPDAANWLGTDRMGSDLLSRIMFGARITITIAFVAVGSAVVIGVPIGLVPGYWRWLPSKLLVLVSVIFLAGPQRVP